MRLIQRHDRLRALWAPLTIILLAAGARAQHEGDPFTPGLRWSRVSAGGSPWIPSRVLFADADQLVWASSGPLGACVEAYSAWGTGPQAPLSRSVEEAPGARVWDLAASDQAAALFAVTHTPGAVNNDVELVRYPAPSASTDGSMEPLWSVASPAAQTGAALVACDAQGERVCFAAWDVQQKRSYVRWHLAQNGAIVAAAEVLAGDLDHLVMSADGALTLASDDERVWVWDSNGALIHYEVADSVVRVADFDATGEHLLLAHGSRARLLSRVAGGFLEVERVDGLSSELAACGALSESGSGWAIAWCDTSANSARYALYAGLSDVLLAEHEQPGSPRGRQNIPQAVSITPRGERAAFATWGDGVQEELLLLDAAEGGLRWGLDLPGSAMDVALDRTGRRVAVVHKDVHANEPGAGGEVRLFDTGEADLALTEAPRPGGVLAAECEAEGASVVFFLFGEASQGPVELPFVSGELWVSLGSRLVVRARRPGMTGRARCELSLPQGAEGLEVAVQAVSRIAGALVASEAYLGLRPR
jgi:hypothetical protein